MAKTRLSSRDFVFLRNIVNDVKTKSVTKPVMQQVGNEIVAQMEDLISKGISPIQGNGRFAGYKNSYLKAIADGRYPGKRQRPVNLELTGQMLNSLRAVAKSNSSVEIGYSNRQAQLKEQGHREGANGQALRPTIPENGESFAASIERGIVNRFIDAVKRYISSLE